MSVKPAARQRSKQLLTTLLLILALSPEISGRWHWWKHKDTNDTETEGYQETTTTIDVLEYQQQALEIHNKYRTKHGAPELEMDDELNQIALKCAEYYARKRKIDHSCPYKKGGGGKSGGFGRRGENLAFRERHPNPYPDDEVTMLSVKGWYDEIEDYDFKKHRSKNGKAVGHFTQVVWKSSERFGFGIAKSGTCSYAVGIYDPAGNFVGKYKENVLPI